jgi:hypothetical protein
MEIDRQVVGNAGSAGVFHPLFTNLVADFAVGKVKIGKKMAVFGVGNYIGQVDGTTL